MNILINYLFPTPFLFKLKIGLTKYLIGNEYKEFLCSQF